MTSNQFVMPKWPLWKIALKTILDWFELDDHEYIRGTLRLRYPFVFWFTILEPRYRRGLSKLLPWRLRCGWASILRQLVWSQCTKCDARFSLRELLKRDGSLTFFGSGSVCHRDCEPSDRFKRMVADMAERDKAVKKAIASYQPFG